MEHENVGPSEKGIPRPRGIRYCLVDALSYLEDGFSQPDTSSWWQIQIAIVESPSELTSYVNIYVSLVRTQFVFQALHL